MNHATDSNWGCAMEFDGRAALAETRANLAKLEACKDHNFQPITPGLFGTRYMCHNCKGEVDGLTAKWYERGRLHGAMK